MFDLDYEPKNYTTRAKRYRTIQRDQLLSLAMSCENNLTDIIQRHKEIYIKNKVYKLTTRYFFPYSLHTAKIKANEEADRLYTEHFLGFFQFLALRYARKWKTALEKLSDWPTMEVPANEITLMQENLN